jgi:hypothetical protein
LFWLCASLQKWVAAHANDQHVCLGASSFAVNEDSHVQLS